MIRDLYCRIVKTLPFLRKKNTIKNSQKVKYFQNIRNIRKKIKIQCWYKNNHNIRKRLWFSCKRDGVYNQQHVTI